MTRFTWDKEVAPGVTTVRADGHSPGHTTFLITSGNGRMMYVADITNKPALFARNPEWQVMFDMDAPKAVETRKRILDMTSADKIRTAFYHGPSRRSGRSRAMARAIASTCCRGRTRSDRQIDEYKRPRSQRGLFTLAFIETEKETPMRFAKLAACAVLGLGLGERRSGGRWRRHRRWALAKPRPLPR